ncbi:MAG: AAA family ATPase [Magnetococcus sp. XQGC-1]
MQLTTLTLENFRRFEQLEISLAGKSPVVFIGDNGSGKTAILEAIAKGLSWLIARINRARGIGSSIGNVDILNGQSSASIRLEVQHQSAAYPWSLAKTYKGREQSQSSDLLPLTTLAGQFRATLTGNPDSASLPLIVYYPVYRVVLDIPLKIKGRHSFGQLDGYENTQQQGVNFRRFFEWFRDQEDSANEPNASQWQKRQLAAVCLAVYSFMPGFANLRIQRRPRLCMLIDKDGHSLDVGQLSQGEKSLMALVGDIARRLIIMNPAMDNPLEGEGIVLIDELDLHLHPRWQAAILGNLGKTFPNIQFIVTTHSPVIIIQEQNLRGFVLSDGRCEPMGATYGLDVNLVLLQEMGLAHIRNPDVQRKLDALLEAIQDGRREEARAQLDAMRQTLPANHLEIAKAELLLRRLEVRQSTAG